MSGLNSRRYSGLRSLENTHLMSSYVSGELRGLGEASLGNFHRGIFEIIENCNGPLEVNSIAADFPLMTVTDGPGYVRTRLLHNPTSLRLDNDGHLDVIFPEVKQVSYVAPLLEDGGTIALHHDSTLEVVSGRLGVSQTTLEDTIQGAAERLSFHAPLAKDGDDVRFGWDANELTLREDGSLTVRPRNWAWPLHENDRTLHLATDGSLTVSDLGLCVVQPLYTAPLYAQADTVGLAYDASLRVSDSVLGFNPEYLHAPLALVLATETTTEGVGLSYADPLTVDAQGMLALKLHKSLTVDDHLLKTNLTNVLKTFGALYNGTGLEFLDMVGADPLEWLDEAVDMGALEDELGDTSLNVMRLKTSGQFSQKGSKLSLVSPGYQRLPFWGVTYDFQSDPALYYSETLQTLHVRDVELDARFTFSPTQDNYAVTKGFLSQFIQASPTGGLDVGIELNGRRELSVRCDATLAVNPSNNLGVNLGALVDNSTVRIVQDRLASGLNFQARNGLSIATGSNEPRLSVVGQSGIVFRDGNVISGENLTASNGITRNGDNFELSLTTGDEDLTLANGVISCNLVGDEASIFKVGNVFRGKPVTAGSGILVVDTGLTYVVSALNPSITKQNNNETSQQTSSDVSTLEVTPADASAIPSVVSIAGPVSAIFAGAAAGALATPFTGASGLVSGLGGAVGGGLGGLGFPFAIVWGESRKRKRQPLLDEAGQPVLDANGEPVYEMTPDGTDWIYQINPDTGEPLEDGAGAITVGIDLDNDLVNMFMDTPRNLTDITVSPKEQVLNLDMLWKYDTHVLTPKYASKLFVDTHTWDWSAIINRPEFGTLALKNSVVLDGSEVTGTLSASKIDPLIATKAYVDGKVAAVPAGETILAGTGLTKTGSTLALNAAQPGVTSLGTLTGLTIAGDIAITGYRRIRQAGGNSSSYTYGAYNQLGDGIHMGYNAYNDNTGWVIQAAGGGTTRMSAGYSGFTFYTGAVGSAPTNEHFRITQGTGCKFTTAVSMLEDLTLSKNAVAATAPTLGNHLTNKTYVDAQIAAIPAGEVIQAGAGLTKTGSQLLVNAAQPGITSLGTLSALAVGGTGGGYTVQQWQSGLAAGGYLGTQVGMNASTRNSAVYGFVNAGGSGATSNNMFLGLVGTSKVRINGLGDLYLESTTPSTSTTTGAFRVPGTGGVGIGGDVNVGGFVAASAGLTTNAGTAGSIHYMMQNGGLPRWGMGLSNTEGGTADGSDFAMWCFKNDGSAGTVYSPFGVSRADGTVRVNRLVASDTVTGATPTAGTHLTTKDYVDDKSWDYVTAITNKPTIETILAGSGLTKAASTLSVNAAQTQITSVGTLTSLTVAGDIVSNNGDIYAGPQHWYHIRGTSAGIIWDNYNSGWVCTDTSWVRSVAGKGIMTSGQVNAGSVYAYTIDCGNALTTWSLQAAGVVSAQGYLCRAGVDGAFSAASNKFNLNWTGSSWHLWCDGTLTGTIQTYSSGRHKKDVRSYRSHALDLVKKLRPVNFRFRDEGVFKDTGDLLGFVAQELKEVSPQLVEELPVEQRPKGTDDIPMAVNPTALIALLTKAVQDLTAKVEALENK